MNRKNLFEELAMDYIVPDRLLNEYKLSNEDYRSLYEQYITFPILENNLNYRYVAHEEVINKLVTDLKIKFVKNEKYLGGSPLHIFNKTNHYYQTIIYKNENSSSEFIWSNFDNFEQIYAENYAKAMDYILENEITLAGISKVFQILTMNIVDFHPVQNELMYRNEELNIYNYSGRRLAKCFDTKKIESAMLQLEKLLQFKADRDQLANHLLAYVIYYQIIVIAPFARYNQAMAELIVKWYLVKQENRLGTFMTNELINYNVENFFLSLENTTDSYNEQDITYFLKSMLSVESKYLDVITNIESLRRYNINNLQILTRRESEYYALIALSSFGDERFNWEMVNQELVLRNEKTTKVGVLKILNSLEVKGALESMIVGRSKIFKIKKIKKEHE